MAGLGKNNNRLTTNAKKKKSCLAQEPQHWQLGGAGIRTHELHTVNE